MDAPRLRVTAVDLFESTYRMRLPFRFGAITVTGGQQAIVRLRIRLPDGREGEGFAADALAAKWFDKDARLSDEDNQHQLRASLQQAREAYLAAPPLSAFALFAQHHGPLQQAGAGRGLNPLVASYGPALLDRAVLDALCRLEGVGLWQALHANLPGIEAASVAPDLARLDLPSFLAGQQPLRRLAARHTVGLLDPITAADVAAGAQVHDGLPQTLEEVIAAYGNRHFKIKLSGQPGADLPRLGRIAALLDTQPPGWAVTLDGNEQFEDAAAVLALWRQMRADPALVSLCAAVRFIEQPIARGRALAAPLPDLHSLPPLLIDESDGELDAFVRARQLGYRGVSTKACKGFYKSILNRARCLLWNAASPADPCFMSAEDLTTLPGLALQQDLALVAWLGIGDVERNAHHFVDGFQGRPVAEAQAFLAAHPDLYQTTPAGPRLRIVGGELAVGSLAAAGFGTTVSPTLDETPAMPASAWPAG